MEKQGTSSPTVKGKSTGSNGPDSLSTSDLDPILTALFAGKTYGLLLSGRVVACSEPQPYHFEARNGMPESRGYGARIEVSDGKKSFVYAVDSDRVEDCPQYKFGTELKIAVDHCKTDKGNITIRGQVVMPMDIAQNGS